MVVEGVHSPGLQASELPLEQQAGAARAGRSVGHGSEGKDQQLVAGLHSHGLPMEAKEGAQQVG